MIGKLVPQDLKCEYLIDPLGLTERRPRLSWLVVSDERGQAQTAYHILVADSPEALDADQGTLWDSGQVMSDQTVHVAYAGVPLQSGQRCYWKVRVWDRHGNPSPYSKPAFWQMGLLTPDDWQAMWIGLDPEPEPELGMDPVVYLRRTFTVDRPITSATLYATAKGVYVPRLNGMRIGDAELAPGWTDYRRRHQVQTYDVASAITQGENVLGIILGEGWYSGYLGFKGIHKYYGQHPRALLQLVLIYEDGTREIIATDDTWQASLGPIRYSDIQMGEFYDARAELGPWDRACYDASGWQPVIVEEREPGVVLEGQRDPAIRVTMEIATQSVTEPEPGMFIFDLGQNFAGRVRLRVAGEAGTEVRLRYGEVLEPDGTLHTANLRSARATDIYILKGEGIEIYEPLFTYHGFRYVEVTGYPGQPTPDAVTGLVMHNDLPITGSFECSNPMINQLWRNILWSQRSNFVSIPTDCPQRDERLGWTGDAQIFCRTATFNMDVATFFSKWLADTRDAQTEEGAFTDIAPQIEGMNQGAPAWGDANIIIPWTLYQVYGDKALIETHFAAMQAWMRHIEEANPLHLRTKRLYNNYGDWVALERGSSPEQIATAYWVKIARMMADMAEALERKIEARYYADLAEEIRQAYIAAYVHPDGSIETDTQAAYVMALDNDLLPPALRSPAAAHLVAAIERHGGHLATGFLGTPPLCFVLAETGYLNVAYRLVTSEEYPSWGYMIKNGATTMWERWNAYTIESGIHDPGMNSFNHYAYGSIGEWLYRVVAGIDAGEPGYRHIRLYPRPGGGLTYVQASYHSIRGTIRSAWHYDEDGLHVKVTVPANTTATLHLDTTAPYTILEGSKPATSADGVSFERFEHSTASFRLESGTYHFLVPAMPPRP